MQQELLVGELVRQGLSLYPGRLSLVWRDRELTYLGLSGQIDAVAMGLANLGVQRGDRVAIYTHNIPQFVQTYYALARLGAIAVPINVHWRGRDLHYLLEKAAVSGIVTLVPLWPRVSEIGGSLPEIQWVVAIGTGEPQPPGTSSWQQLISNGSTAPSNLPSLEGRDPMMIAYSAGMSEPPKPALLSHFNLLANCEQVADMNQVSFLQTAAGEQASNSETATPNFEVALLPLPLSDLFCLNIGLNLTMKLGGTAVLMENFEANAAIELIQERKCSLLFGSPPIFKAIVEATRFAPGRFDLSSLKHAFSYGGPIPNELQKAFYERTGKPIFVTYGAVEASPVISCTAAGSQLVANSIGYPVGVMQVRVGNQPNHAGQLVAEGPNVMLGYFDSANPVTLKGEGRFASGDIAQSGPDGRIYFIERGEDILVAAGRPVLPTQIEQVLLTRPDIIEAAALPVEDGYGGRQLVAFIIPTSMPPDFTEADLMLECRQKLPAQACPVRIYIYEDGPTLPRLPDGRIWRRALRALVAPTSEVV